MNVKERKHRLRRETYRGDISVAFTICLRGVSATTGFTEAETVERLVGILTPVVREAECYVPVYCFMPDHQHLIITGQGSDSDIRGAIVKYKQKTGFWLSKNRSFEWQKDFYDHIIRSDEDIATQVRYILDNPVRKGLVKSWEEYAYKGSIGCRLEDILRGII